MRFVCFVGSGLAIALGSLVAASAHEELPPGPIHDRHELMEEVGKNAKVIGDAMKAGEIEKIPGPASEIESAAKKIAELFPEGSVHPNSRAKPEIWTDPSGFALEIKKLETAAAALAVAAQTRTNVPQAANDLFASCKSCHTNFRVPEE